MVRRPNLFKYLPIRLRIFNCWDAFLQISDICLSKFRWESSCVANFSGLSIRDRPFNLQGGVMVFCFVQNFFVVVAQSVIFFPELYDKNSESDYYVFPPPKLEYFFQQHWESEYFFTKKP